MGVTVTSGITEVLVSSGGGIATPVSLENGGTGASLSDPNADRIYFWDDSAGSTAFLAPSTGIAITTTNLTIDTAWPGQAAITTLGTIATGVWNGTTIAVANGGTGATTASAAVANLGFRSTQPQRDITINARADSATSLTSMASAALFFPQAAKRNVLKVDLTNYTEARLLTNISTGATPDGKLVAMYQTTFNLVTTSATDMLQLGTSEIQTPVSAAGLIVTAWTPIVSAARADVFIGIVQTLGNDTNTPGIGAVVLQVR